MAEVDDEVTRWLARTLDWNRTLTRLRGRHVDQVIDVRVDVRRVPRPDPVSRREPERVPFGAPRARVPQHVHPKA